MLGEDADALDEQLAREDNPLESVRPDDLRSRRIVPAETVVESKNLLNRIGTVVERRARRRDLDRQRDLAARRRPAEEADVKG